MRVKLFSIVFFSIFSRVRFHFKRIFALVILFAFIILFLMANKKRINGKLFDTCPDTYISTFQEVINLERIPDLIHFHRNYAKAGRISKSELACIKAALRIHNTVYIHSENPLATQQALTNMNFSHNSLIILSASNSFQLPPLVSILWNHGGIYLQNDVYLIRRLDKLRFYHQVKTNDGSIVAANKQNIRAGWYSNSPWETVDGVVLEHNWGALYLKEVLQDCAIKAIRLGGDKRNMLSWYEDHI